MHNPGRRWWTFLFYTKFFLYQNAKCCCGLTMMDNKFVNMSDARCSYENNLNKFIHRFMVLHIQFRAPWLVFHSVPLQWYNDRMPSAGRIRFSLQFSSHLFYFSYDSLQWFTSCNHHHQPTKKKNRISMIWQEICHVNLMAINVWVELYRTKIHSPFDGMNNNSNIVRSYWLSSSWTFNIRFWWIWRSHRIEK